MLIRIYDILFCLINSFIFSFYTNFNFNINIHLYQKKTDIENKNKTYYISLKNSLYFILADFYNNIYGYFYKILF